MAAGILDEEALSDALVYNNKSDLWLLAHLVVQLGEGLTELLELAIDDLIAHGITHTISVDDKVGWELPVVVLSEDLDCLLQGLLHLRLHNLLALPLDDVL